VTDLFAFPEILIAFIFMGGHGGPARPVAETAAAVAVGCGEAPVSSGNRRARATERTRSGASYSGECACAWTARSASTHFDRKPFRTKHERSEQIEVSENDLERELPPFTRSTHHSLVRSPCAARVANRLAKPRADSLRLAIHTLPDSPIYARA
jgi:hypothetical protein